jgi:hypothetical protein
MLKTIGGFTTLVGMVIAGFLVFVGIRSIPDVQRYMRIRSM